MSNRYEFAVAVGQFRTYLRTTPPSWSDASLREALDPLLHAARCVGLTRAELGDIVRRMIARLRPEDWRMRAAIGAELPRQDRTGHLAATA